MSERLQDTNPPSNEEIIEDLTKDLKTTLATNEDTEGFVINPEHEVDAPSSSGDSSGRPKTSDIPKTNTYCDEEKLDQVSDDDIDEESLKKAEVDLTDDQKAERKLIAEALKIAGNDAFKGGDYQLSLEKYTDGLQTCPLQFTSLRAVLYCNRGAVRMKQKKYPSAIRDCTKAIQLDEKYLKAYVRRAQSYEAVDKLDECLADYNKVLTMDPCHREAKIASYRLPPLIEEKNEKLKTEMLGKLKEFGNMILKPFGLSTENFQLEQDPESKGYKINYKQ